MSNKTKKNPASVQLRPLDKKSLAHVYGGINGDGGGPIAQIAQTTGPVVGPGPAPGPGPVG
jgi:hypothetical protein